MAERSHRATDRLPRFVGAVTVPRPGFVEFTFSVGDPSTALEMILPTTAFEEFCREQDVTFLADSPDALAATPAAPGGPRDEEWTQ